MSHDSKQMQTMETGDHSKNGASPKSQMSRRNKIFILLAVLYCGISTPLFSQVFYPSFFAPNAMPDLKPIVGGKEGKTYAVIFSSNLTKQGLVDSTVNVLKMWQLVDDSYKRNSEISDDLSTFTISIFYKKPLDFMKAAAMGIKTHYWPVRAHCDVIFEFYANGKVKLVFRNFTTETFVLSDYNTTLCGWDGHQYAVAASNSAITNVLIVANKGVDGFSEFKSQMSDYLKDVNGAFAIYDCLEKSGTGSWYNDKNYIEYGLTNKQYQGSKYQNDFAKIYFDEGRLLSVNQLRWENKIRPHLDNFIKTIVIACKAEIDAINEDGENTWQNMDGKVLPTNPKKQKEYIKKKLEY
jgi:hypothetical protein